MLFATKWAAAQHPLTDEERSRLAALPVANIGDAMDRMGMVDASIKPVWSGARTVGTAHTVWTRAGDNRAIHEAIASARPGDVIVVNGQGDRSRALMGDLMAERATLAGIAGVVVDGAVRDAEGLAEIGLPVFARAVNPAGPYKNGPGATGVVIALGGVAVIPGDVIVADADGVVVIPRGNLDEVLEAAEAKFRSEEQTRAGMQQPVGAAAER